MYRLQFHRFISECFASNFVLFLSERDGLSKWHQHNITSHVKGDVCILYINFDNGVNLCGNYFRGNFFCGS